MRRFWSFVAIGAAVVAGCATGVDSETSEATESTGAGGATNGASSTTTSSTSGGTGGAGGMIDECPAPRHVCGGICVDNTPETGCYQSTSCTACPTPTNGSATCTSDGLCDVTCTAPYMKNGTDCTCPTQCCSNSDCMSGEECESGSCIEPCDENECFATCAFMNMFGFCQNNMCVCV